MLEIFVHTFIHTLKLIPFLFLAFLIIEVLEHKLSKKSKKIIQKSGRFGPLFGGLFGLFPQCGFSAMATNLYITRIITLGTLVAIYLTTSDEMLPIMLSHNVSVIVILKILAIKFIVGVLFGFLIDLFFNKKKLEPDYSICSDSTCHCEEGIIISSLKHTFNIIIYIFICTLGLNILINFVGEEQISKIFLKDSIFAPFISSLIGLIPNCSASVIITELYLNNVITFGTLISGLLTGSGVAILILFKYNKNIKENLKILSLIYFIGSFIGVIFQIFNFSM